MCTCLEAGGGAGVYGQRETRENIRVLLSKEAKTLTDPRGASDHGAGRPLPGIFCTETTGIKRGINNRDFFSKKCSESEEMNFIFYMI